MIFIGTINVSRTRERGEFQCPSCKSLQSYRLRAKRPWLTLYLIPVVPIGSIELTIECDSCRCNWDPSILKIGLAEDCPVDDAQARHEIFRAMILFVLLDGYMEADEVEPLGILASRIFGRTIDREELGRLCSLAEQTEIPVSNYLESVFRRWNPEQKSFAIQALFMAGSLRPEMGKERTGLLLWMRQNAGVSEIDFEELIQDCLGWEDASTS